MRLVIPTICAFALACNNADDTATTSNADESESAADTDTDTNGTEESNDTETESADETETDGTEEGNDTDEPNPVCESEEPVGDWLFMLTDGTFPDDVPENFDESCTVIAHPESQLALECSFGEFSLPLIGLSPMPALPAPGATAQVRLHHEPGWLDWPDLWIAVDVEGGDSYSFQASSVLLPTQGTYEVPWAPSDTLAECGPFSLGDTCGEQVGKELVFTVEGEQVTAWHGSYATATIAERQFEVWLNVARHYVNPSETCDFSPLWYAFVTRRAG